MVRGLQPKIAVVMVNWNGWRDTLAAYESLKASTHKEWEAIVVENGSTDGSLAELRKAEKLILCVSRTNLGFAGACNRWIITAQRRGADYVYLFNNDATVKPDTLAKLVAALQDAGDKAVVGSTIRFVENGRLQFWGAHKTRDELPVWTHGDEDRFAAAPAMIETAFVMGASLMAAASTFEEIGSLEDRFFLNFEETDWCCRAKRAGYRNYIVKDALILHKGGGTIGPN